MHPAVAGSARATRRGVPIPLSTTAEKKEKKSRTVLFSFVFPTFPWQRCFCSSLVILSYKVPFVSLILMFLKATVMAMATKHLREHWPFQTTVHMCRKQELSGLHCVPWMSSWIFFKTEEALLCKGINHQSWSRFCNGNFKRQHLQGETIKRTTIPGFPIP